MFFEQQNRNGFSFFYINVIISRIFFFKKREKEEKSKIGNFQKEIENYSTSIIS